MLVEDEPEPSHRSASWRSKLLRHEVLLLILGSTTTVALALRASLLSPATLSSFVATLVLWGALRWARRFDTNVWNKLRFASSYLFVLWFYSSVAWIVPALELTTHDETLLAIDKAMLGQTPALWVESSAPKWIHNECVNEVMSACYLTYLLYLHLCVAHALLLDPNQSRRFADRVFSAFAVGLAGYLVLPAVGPATALSDRFDFAIEGPLFTPLNQWIVALGSSVYDAFPSLHVLITLTLLDFDRRFHRRRFWIMIVPSIGIFASAIYLRYHYLVDLVAGGAIFAVLLLALEERATVDGESSTAK